MRLALLALLAAMVPVTACKCEQPGAWPQAEVDGVKAGCLKSIGSPTTCDCVATELAGRLPYERVKAWGFAPTPAFAAERALWADALLACGRDAGLTAYSPRLRERMMKTCLAREATRKQCECFVSEVEQRVPVSDLLVAGMNALLRPDAGVDVWPLSGLLAQAATDCLAADDEAPWPSSAVEALERACIAKGAGDDFCRCYASKSKEVIRYAEVVRSATDPVADEAVTARFEQANLDCLEAQARQKGVRPPARR